MKEIRPLIYIYDKRIDYRNLYAINLLVYINAEVETFDVIDDLILRSESRSPSAVFIKIENAEDVEKIFNLSQIQKKATHKFKIIIQYKTIINVPDIILYKDALPIKDFVQIVAKDLNITSKQMAEINFGDFYPIPGKFLLPGWQVNQRIYVKDSDGKFVSHLYEGDYFKAEDLNDDTFNRQYFCDSKKRLILIDSFTFNMKSLLDSNNLTKEERLIQTEIAFSMISATVSKIGLPETTRDLAKSAISSMEKVVDGNKTLSQLYNMLKENSNSLRYKRSLICFHIGQFLLAKETWTSRLHYEQWTYLSFFHDILVENDEWIFFESDDEVQKSNLSSRDKAIMINHARLISQIVSQSKELPMGLDVLLKQHHGSKMGDSLNKCSMSISTTCIYFVLVIEYINFLLSQGERVKSNDEIYSFVDTLFKKFPFPNFRKAIPVLRQIPLY